MRRPKPLVTRTTRRTDIDGFAGSDGFLTTTRPGRVATRDETLRATIHTPMSPLVAQGVSQIARSGLRDVVSDREAREFAAKDGADALRPPANAGTPGAAEVEPRTPENLPAVISHAIERAGDRFDPRWHMVRRLPGYLAEPIRRLGRSLIGAFTQTPIEEIQVVSTLSNSETEVKMMMAWIAKHGVRQDVATLDVDAVISGYRPDVQKWAAEGYSFLLVKDMAGYYVYAWPRDHDLELTFDQRPSLPRP